MESKEWAPSQTAQELRALLVTITLNLRVLFERCLECKERIRDEKVRSKMNAIVKEAQDRPQREGRKIKPLSINAIRPTPRSLPFIRGLRHDLENLTAWGGGIRTLKPFMDKYLT